MSDADVTVVIAAYRAESTIDATLASVVAQTVQPAAVIVVDDCSPDDTAAIASRWSDRLPLRVVRFDTNRGPAAARDSAVRAATTTLVAFLDADDVWLPDHLETMVATYERAGGLVTADVLRWIPGRAVGTRTFGDQVALPPFEQQRTAIYRHNFVFSGTLFARQDYLDVGGMRDAFRGPEDWDLWIRFTRHRIPVSRPDHPTVVYRLASGSLSNRDLAQIDAELAVLDTAADEVADDDERRAVASARRRVAARRGLFAAYEAGRDGNTGHARRLALRGLVGGRWHTARPVAFRLAALIVAPRWGTAARDARRHQPRWWLSRS